MYWKEMYTLLYMYTVYVYCNVYFKDWLKEFFKRHSYLAIFFYLDRFNHKSFCTLPGLEVIFVYLWRFLN